jgi:hypothetical protein
MAQDGRPVVDPMAIEVSELRSARVARQHISRMLLESSVRESTVLGDALVATSELVTNAISASGTCSMRAWFWPSTQLLRVEVSDAADEMPMVQPRSSTRVGGHGLRIVEAISGSWGVIAHESSKTVWFEMTTHPGTPS